MKLTEDNTFVGEFAGILPDGDILVKIYCKKMEKGIQVKQQILDNAEKAENNSIYREFYNNWHHVLQENKKLKEELSKTVGDYITLKKEQDILKEKLEKYDEITTFNGDLESDVKEFLAGKSD